MLLLYDFHIYFYMLVVSNSYILPSNIAFAWCYINFCSKGFGHLFVAAEGGCSSSTIVTTFLGPDPRPLNYALETKRYHLYSSPNDFYTSHVDAKSSATIPCGCFKTAKSLGCVIGTYPPHKWAVQRFRSNGYSMLTLFIMFPDRELLRKR